LLDCYHTALLQQGVRGYDRQALDDDYRLSVLWQIATPVWQANAKIPPVIWWNNLERIMLAVNDLGCRDLLAWAIGFCKVQAAPSAAQAAAGQWKMVCTGPKAVLLNPSRHLRILVRSSVDSCRGAADQPPLTLCANCCREHVQQCTCADVESTRSPRQRG